MDLLLLEKKTNKAFSKKALCLLKKRTFQKKGKKILSRV